LLEQKGFAMDIEYKVTEEGPINHKTS